MFRTFACAIPSSRARRAPPPSPPRSRSTFRASCITALGNMQPSQQMWRQRLVSSPCCVAQPVAGDFERCRACRCGSSGRQWRPVLSCEPVPWTVASFWATWKSIVQGRRAAVTCCSAASSLASSSPVEILPAGSRLPGRCSPACRAACGPCRPESRACCGAIDHFQKLHHPPPTVHAAPANLSFGGQPLAVVLGDVAGLAERVGDPLAVAHRVSRTRLPRTRPSRSARRRWAGCPARRSRSAMRQPLRTCVEELRPVFGVPIAEPPPVGGQTGATTVPITSFRARALSASRLMSSSVASMSTCGAKRNRSKPSNLTPSTSAAAVRSSIVSRSIGGSASGPLPTTPGQAALWSLGKLLGCS